MELKVTKNAIKKSWVHKSDNHDYFTLCMHGPWTLNKLPQYTYNILYWVYEGGNSLLFKH